MTKHQLQEDDKYASVIGLCISSALFLKVCDSQILKLTKFLIVAEKVQGFAKGTDFMKFACYCVNSSQHLERPAECTLSPFVHW